MPDDRYRTLQKEASALLKIKGSRFIAEAFVAETMDAAEAQWAAVRNREHGATHHCMAYRMGPAGDTIRYTDDGEPKGTAGLPILRKIEGRGLTNTLVVVTRYYGGTKLGTGGLSRAYGESADAALAKGGACTHIMRTPVMVRFSYADTSPAMHTIGQFDTVILDMQYGAQTTLVVGVRRSEVSAFGAAFTEALRGRGQVGQPTASPPGNA